MQRRWGWEKLKQGKSNPYEASVLLLLLPFLLIRNSNDYCPFIELSSFFTN